MWLCAGSRVQVVVSTVQWLCRGRIRGECTHGINKVDFCLLPLHACDLVHIMPQYEISSDGVHTCWTALRPKHASIMWAIRSDVIVCVPGSWKGWPKQSTSHMHHESQKKGMTLAKMVMPLSCSRSKESMARSVRTSSLCGKDAVRNMEKVLLTSVRAQVSFCERKVVHTPWNSWPFTSVHTLVCEFRRDASRRPCKKAFCLCILQLQRIVWNGMYVTCTLAWACQPALFSRDRRGRWQRCSS